MTREFACALVLALFLLLPLASAAEEGDRREPGTLPDLDALTRVPVTKPTLQEAPGEAEAESDEAAWRRRFRTLRVKIEREERLLALKRAELYDKIEQGKTEKKPHRFAIEGFVINTEKSGDEPRFIDPLEREVFEKEKELEGLRRELRELDFQASVAGVPMAWRR
jgi:hypothetical protein